MKSFKTFSFFLFFLLLFSSSVSAIGVSPPSYQLEYLPGETYELSFSVRNNADAPRGASISLKGGMSEYITLSTDSISTIGVNSVKTFTATVQLPDDVSVLKPGRNEVEVYIKEQIPSSTGFMIGTGVIASIYVHVPYPGQYADIASFIVAEGQAGINEGETVPVSFTIVNRGLDDLQNTQAEIVLEDQQGTLVDKVRYENINIPTGKQYQESFSFMTEKTSPGDYRATIFYTYPGRTINKTKGVAIGNFSVALINYSKQLEQKGIAPFTIKVKNRWKGYVYVSAQLSVQGAPLAKSSREKVADFRGVSLESYLDTTDLALGIQNATLLVTAEKVNPVYGGETITEKYPITFELIKPKKATKESPFANISTTTILFIILGILLLSTAILFILLMKKKK